MAGAWAYPRSHFDFAQHERPLAGEGDQPVAPTRTWPSPTSREGAHERRHYRGGDAPRPHSRTLTPLVPLSLRAYKEEGERRTEADACALHMRLPLVQYWGRREGDTPPRSVRSTLRLRSGRTEPQPRGMDYGSGGGMTEGRADG